LEPSALEGRVRVSNEIVLAAKKVPPGFARFYVLIGMHGREAEQFGEQPELGWEQSGLRLWDGGLFF
jgi:hypothetical protein